MKKIKKSLDIIDPISNEKVIFSSSTKSSTTPSSLNSNKLSTFPSTTIITKNSKAVNEYKVFQFEDRNLSSIKSNNALDVTIFPGTRKSRDTIILSSFSNLNSSGGPFRTEPFKFHNHFWQLLFIPYHKISTKDNDQFCSIYLISNDARNSIDDKSSNISIKCDFSIELYNYKKGKTHLKAKSFEFTKYKQYSGFSDFIKQSDIDLQEYYREKEEKYYFTVILTMDLLIEVFPNSITKPYKIINDTLKELSISQDNETFNYYRSLIISLYTIPMFRKEVLKCTLKDPTELFYQLQRIFFYIQSDRNIVDYNFYKIVKYFLNSNHLNRFEFSKILEKLIVEMAQNSKEIESIIPVTESQIKLQNKYTYKESIFNRKDFIFDNSGSSKHLDDDGSEYKPFSEKNDKSLTSLGGIPKSFYSGTTEINKVLMKEFEKKIDGSLVLNIPYGVQCLNPNQFEEKLLEHNQVTKESLQNILFVSFNSRSLDLESSLSQSDSNSNNVQNRFATFKFPESFTIFKEKQYQLFSCWSFEKNEYHLSSSSTTASNGNGTHVTYIYDFSNKFWIKFKPDGVERASFDYLLQNSCGLDQDRLVLDNMGISRDLTFSYMLIYISKDKVDQLFNCELDIPLPQYQEFVEMDKLILSLEPQQSSSPSSPTSSVIQQNPPQSPLLSTQESSTIPYEQPQRLQKNESDLIRELLTKIDTLKDEKFALEEKTKTLEITTQERNKLNHQINDQLSKIDRLEKQLLYLDLQIKNQIFKIYQQYQEETKKYYEEIQRMNARYDQLNKDNNDNIAQKRQFFEEKHILFNEKTALVEQKNELSKEVKQLKLQLANAQSQINLLKSNAGSLGNGAPLSPLNMSTNINHLEFDNLKSQLCITDIQLEAYDNHQVLELAGEINKLQETVRKNLEERVYCNICMEQKRNIVFVPCGHYYVCESCASPLKQCPYCREAIKQKIKIVQ